MATCKDCRFYGVCIMTRRQADADAAGCKVYEAGKAFEERDVVEVVRCKDCKKISPSVTPIKDSVWCREFRAYMPCDGFCSYGERREGE